jgi:predicted HicB family RNase H-like nuclease
VNVSEETKVALKEKADEQGTSVSRFASDALDRAVAE